MMYGIFKGNFAGSTSTTQRQRHKPSFILRKNE